MLLVAGCQSVNPALQGLVVAARWAEASGCQWAGGLQWLGVAGWARVEGSVEAAGLAAVR